MVQSRLLKAEFNPKNRIGLHYYDPHQKKWSKLVGIKNNHFVLDDGERKRYTTGPLDAAYFADQPFDVLAKYNSYAPN